MKYVYSVIPTASTGECTDGIISFGTQFTILVHAEREGYENSAETSITINHEQIGDMNGDGVISIADVTGLVNVILGK